MGKEELLMKKQAVKTKGIDVPIIKGSGETSVQKLSPLTSFEREMLSTLSEMERWFEDARHRPFLGFHRFPLVNFLGERRTGDFVPAVDMYEEGDELVIRAELAGINKEDVKVEVAGNTLTLSGEKRGEEKVQKKDFYRVEQSFGSFCRTLELPEGIKTDGAKASYNDGLLEIRFPRTAESQKVFTVPIEK
jgi:HSP20 family protein